MARKPDEKKGPEEIEKELQQGKSEISLTQPAEKSSDPVTSDSSDRKEPSPQKQTKIPSPLSPAIM